MEGSEYGVGSVDIFGRCMISRLACLYAILNIMGLFFGKKWFIRMNQRATGTVSRCCSHRFFSWRRRRGGRPAHRGVDTLCVVTTRLERIKCPLLTDNETEFSQSQNHDMKFVVAAGGRDVRFSAGANLTNQQRAA